MTRRTAPWPEIRRAYERGEGAEVLGRRYGLSPATVLRHARQERWDGGGQTASVQRRLAQAAQNLRQASAALLSGAESEQVSVKEVKELAALLRELTALERSLAEDAPAAVRVVLEPPLDDWAR